MGFLDSINDAINKGASETSRLIEVGKLKTQVGSLNKSRVDLMAALGAVAYDQFRTSKLSLDEFAPIAERIRAVEIEIAQTQKRIDELSVVAAGPSVVCPACGTANAMGAKFCVSCGGSLEGVDQHVLCTSCGAAVPPGGKFCVKCGTLVPEAAGGEQAAELAAETKEAQE
jgi:formate dehydrogenase maturation protein FdhE